jgi:sigma-B regulation protein RsbU (phosphoserine phosphatase)
MVLGVDCDAVYRRAVVTLEPGDLLVLFTDGVTEAMNLEQEDYGEEALQSLVGRALDLTPREIMDLIIQDVHRHSGGAQQADDITLIVAAVDGD